MSYGVELDT